MSLSRRPLAAFAGAAGAAAFARWDATDTKGGVGLTRAAAATSTAALIVADYKWSLFGLEKDSPPFVSARASLHERAAARLLRLCERNGGLYTKAGQFIGTASGMPVPFQRELSKLQDSATPLPFEDVQRVVDEAFGAGAADPPAATKTDGVVAYSASTDDANFASNAFEATSSCSSTVFSFFDREPIAAASLAQVHRAVTANGDEVAVKVQRPGLRRQFDVDLATMRLITSAITVAFPNFDFTFLVPEFADRLTRELDFELEGRMCERAGRALADDPRMVTPDIYWELTTSKVLTMEYVRGAKIDDGPGLRAAGVDPREAAEALADTFARTLLCHGFVHGDPHPGNMLVRRQSDEVVAKAKRDPRRKLSPFGFFSRRDARDASGVQIVLLDHGLYTELDEPARRRMCRLWHAVAMRDPSKVRETSEEMGVPPSLRWVLPQLMARQQSHVAPVGTAKERAGSVPDPRSAEGAAARVDGLIRGGRPPMTMDQVSEFGKSLPREMMVVMRSNALIRNITRRLAADIAETDARDKSAGARSVFGWLSRRSFKKGRGRFGLSAGGYVGGDVGRRMDRRRQWAMAKYACLGVTLPSALAECGSSNGGLAALPLRTRARWYARVARVWTRIWTFRSMQYSVMLAIRTLPPGLSEPVVAGFTDVLVRARGGLPAA
jgi:aarF domain-containing kinase